MAKEMLECNIKVFGGSKNELLKRLLKIQSDIISGHHQIENRYSSISIKRRANDGKIVFNELC